MALGDRFKTDQITSVAVDFENSVYSRQQVQWELPVWQSWLCLELFFFVWLQMIRTKSGNRKLMIHIILINHCRRLINGQAIIQHAIQDQCQRDVGICHWQSQNAQCWQTVFRLTIRDGRFVFFPRNGTNKTRPLASCFIIRNVIFSRNVLYSVQTQCSAWKESSCRVHMDKRSSKHNGNYLLSFFFHHQKQNWNQENSINLQLAKSMRRLSVNEGDGSRVLWLLCCWLAC